MSNGMIGAMRFSAVAAPPDAFAWLVLNGTKVAPAARRRISRSRTRNSLEAGSSGWTQRSSVTVSETFSQLIGTFDSAS